MVPFIWNFQKFKIDLVNVRDFPPIFYRETTVDAVKKRFIQEIDRRKFEDLMDGWFGSDVFGEIKSYVNYDGIFP